MTTWVVGAETRTIEYGLEAEVTIRRYRSDVLPYSTYPDAVDLPADIRKALLGWLAEAAAPRHYMPEGGRNCPAIGEHWTERDLGDGAFGCHGTTNLDAVTCDTCKKDLPSDEL